jgi:hypothetical protein
MKNIFAGSIAVCLTFLLARAHGQDSPQSTVQLVLSGDAVYSGDVATINDDTGVVANPYNAVVLGDIGFAGAERIDASALGYVAGGVLRIYAQAHASATDSLFPGNTSGASGSITANAYVTYEDFMFISNLGPPGALVTTSFLWNLSGGVTSSGTASGTIPDFDSGTLGGGGEARLYATAQGFGDGINPVLIARDLTVATVSSGGKGTVTNGFPSPKSILMTRTLQLGPNGGVFLPVDFTLHALAYASAYSLSSATGTREEGGALSDFSHTATWGGMTITDASGNLITGWTVTSQSGFDYSQPFVDVPEPSTFALLAIALPGLLLAMRSCRRIGALG